MKKANKTELIAFRMTKRDRNALRKLAAKLEISESDLIRRAVLLYKENGPAVLEPRTEPKRDA